MSTDKLSVDEIMVLMNLTPDELRCEIAKAKGWKYQDESPANYDKRIIGWWIHPTQLNINGNPKAHTGNSRPFPNWSESIVDAWELVEEARKDGAKLVLFENQNEEYNTYYAYFGGQHRIGNEPWITYGNTAPLAICHAYMMWKAHK